LTSTINKQYNRILCNTVFNSSKKDAANQCYEDILQRENCDFTGPIQDLIIGQFLPMVCPVIETDLPKCYK